ncbi:tail fiber assembly protein [Pseudomonas veronii]
MPYFQCTNGSLHFLSADDISRDGVLLLPEGAKAVTDIVAAAIQSPEPSNTELAAELRQRRGELLAETDYLMTPDYPIDAAKLAAMKSYRQALRDIPGKPDFPKQVVWPQLPN